MEKGRCFWLALVGVLCACSSDRCQVSEKVARVQVPFDMRDLSKEMRRQESAQAMESFLHAHPLLRDKFFDGEKYPSHALLAQALYKTFQDKHIDTLHQEVKNTFFPLETLKEDWMLAFKRVKAVYPDFVPPQIDLLVSGLYRDVYFTDGLWMVSLDYFLGPTAKYVPLELPVYLRRRYAPPYVVPMSLLHLSRQFISVNKEDNTLLADMISVGKSCYFVSKMLPCAEDTVLVGYTQEELRRVRKNAHVIWANFVQNEWLYETSPMIKNKFIGERPRVPEIGPRCPGRIGVWLGWEIVKAYAKRTRSSLPRLMKEMDSQKILRQSQYKPSS